MFLFLKLGCQLLTLTETIEVNSQYILGMFTAGHYPSCMSKPRAFTLTFCRVIILK